MAEDETHFFDPDNPPPLIAFTLSEEDWSEGSEDSSVVVLKQEDGLCTVAYRHRRPDDEYKIEPISGFIGVSEQEALRACYERGRSSRS